MYIYNYGIILISPLFKDNEQSLQPLCKNYAEDRARELNHNSDVYQLDKIKRRRWRCESRRNRKCLTMILRFRLVSIWETKVAARGYLVELQSVVAKCGKTRKIDSLNKSIKNFLVPQSYIFPTSQNFATLVILLVLVFSLWLWPLIFFSLPRYIRFP